MSGNLVVLGYVAVITLGLRWNTLPEDIKYTQDLLTVGTRFCFSVLKQLCKKRLSTFTDNSLVYPRPPRNDLYSPSPAESNGNDNIPDSSEEELEQERDEESEKQSEESDSDAQGDQDTDDKEE